MSTQKEFTVITEKETVIRKGFHGWKGETITSVNGQTFEISTLKRSSGKLTTSAMPIQVIKTPGFLSTQFDSDALFNKTINLISEVVSRVNEKAVKAQHFEALTIFEKMVEAGEIQPEVKQEPEIGTILFLDGYGKGKGCPGNSHIVYKIEDSSFGRKYFTVEKDTLCLNVKDHVKPFSDKFGIGTYFEPDFKFQGSEDDLNNLIIDAQQLATKEANQEEAAKLMRTQIRAAKIEEGKKLLNVPNWAKTVIVADYYEDRSDSQTDYFATSTTQTYFLAFSKNTRNNMSELKKASKRFELTENFVALLENPEDGKDLIEEYTDGHHLLPNYFLGTSRWYGWKVTKRKYFDLTNEEILNKLYIAAAEGRYLCEDKKEEGKEEAPGTFENLEIQVIDYSEKAIAVVGETKAIKDDLKKLGGRFNYRLKCGAGWIFPKTKLEDVKTLLSNKSK